MSSASRSRDTGAAGQHPEVAIVGGGIAGLALALALRRRGVPCRVFEQTAELRQAGAGIQLSPNATRLLRRVGCDQYLREVAIRPELLEIHDWASGRLILRVGLGAECDAMFGAPMYTVLRQDLLRALRRAASSCEVVVGARLASLEPAGDRVLMYFDGGSVYAADAVVGADGIHSTVGSQLHGDPLVFSGRAVYRGVASGPPPARPTIRLWSGPTQHCIAYPVNAEGAVAFAAVVSAEPDLTPSHEELRAAYQGWAPEVHELFAAASLRRLELYDREPASTWVSNRIALVGDAAHPMLPFLAQGANAAVEDSFVLAGCLAEAWPQGVEAALVRYQALRLPRARSLHAQARARPGFSPQMPGRPRPRGSYLAAQRWIYGYDAERAMVYTNEEEDQWVSQ